MMNRKKMLKRLIGVACFLVVLCFTLQYAFAAGETVCSDDVISKPETEREIQKLFDISYKSENDGSTVITRSCKDNVVQDVPLSVYDMNSLVDSSVKGDSLVCKGNKPVSITVYPNLSNFSNKDGENWTYHTEYYDREVDITEPPSMVVVLKADKQFSYKVGSCDLKEAFMSVVIPNTKGNVGAAEMNVPDYSIDTTLGGNYIDCEHNKVIVNSETGETKDISSNSFEAHFCESWTRAKNENKIFDGSKKIDTQEYKCDYKVGPSTITDIDKLKDDDYFTNRHSTYAEEVTPDAQKTVYTYHLAPENPATGKDYTIKETVSCEITCQEAVDVEYGPPVVSRAGMCFQYKVRVTSRVSCGMTKAPKEPDCNKEVCTPSPICIHPGVTIIYTQGGPNEEFDACVKECDGGKYSKTCSQKCYQQVYGSVSANAKVNSANFDSLFPTFVRNGTGVDVWDSSTCDGYYVYNGNEIQWAQGYTNSPGRWYCVNANSWQYGNTDRQRLYGVFEEDGFYRHIYKNDHCHDDCSWHMCAGKSKKDVYLNNYVNGVNIPEQDCINNRKSYETLVNTCKAQAKCSTSTAEFTIEADYNDQKNNKVTIHFPYDNNDQSTSDKITFRENGQIVESTVDQKNTTLLKDYPTSNNGLWGCYNSADSSAQKTQLYRATWTFPGTFINRKTGEISYESKSTKAWDYHQGRFCIPNDAKNVNVKYWSLYRKKQLADLGLNDKDKSSFYSDKYNEICNFQGGSQSFLNVGNDITEDDITWNIHAKTWNFGFFDWAFNIDCFYAINDNPLCGNTCCEEGTCGNEDDPNYDLCQSTKYRIRPTDPEDMFPNELGSITVSPLTTGRIPGYNWSEYAINDKNDNYKSNPVEYMRQIQNAASQAKSSGKEIYSSDNLDYEFILSPSTLRKMRRDQASSVGKLGSDNYAAFDDDGFIFNKKSGIVRYKSDKIRDLEGEKKVPNTPQLYCNNMINWETTTCDKVHG